MLSYAVKLMKAISTHLSGEVTIDSSTLATSKLTTSLGRYFKTRMTREWGSIWDSIVA